MGGKTEEELKYDKITLEIDYAEIYKNDNNIRINNLLNYLKNKIKSLKLNTKKSLVCYLYSKLSLNLIYFESDYKEEFEMFLDDFLYEIAFDNDSLKKMLLILKYSEKNKDYSFLRSVYLNIISIESMQCIRFAALDVRKEMLHNSLKGICYCPGEYIELSNPEKEENIRESIDSSLRRFKNID